MCKLPALSFIKSVPASPDEDATPPMYDAITLLELLKIGQG